jgi:predicted flavoprotein YhiN
MIVIGGGAAGFFAAIACAEAYPRSQVILLEAARSPLAKVRVSGGGRCNVTHACFDPALFVQNYPRGGKALRGAFARFQAKDTVEWFQARGVMLKTEADGRMFPVTDNSETIIACLMEAARRARIQMRMGVPVQRVGEIEAAISVDAGSDQGQKEQLGDREKGEAEKPRRFWVELKSGERLEAEHLLLATGSSPVGYAIAQSLGHTIVPPVPSLFTFNLRDPRLEGLAGVSVPAVQIRLQTEDKTSFEQTGALLITHWGISGPAVLKLSAWGARSLHDHHYQASLQINWLPTYKQDVLRQQLTAVRSQLAKKLVFANCPVPIPRRLWERLLLYIGVPEAERWADVSNKTLNLLLQELTHGQYTVLGKGVFKEEFVTCGGVNLKEIDFKTMQSRQCPGLFFAGEILDIDGITGGFNFQSAWTTGWLAGQGMSL